MDVIYSFLKRLFDCIIRDGYIECKLNPTIYSSLMNYVGYAIELL